MRLVIDMQGAQTESRFRGIGRFTMSLSKAMLEQSGAHEVFLVLNGAYTHTIEPIRAAFDGMLSQDRIHVFEVAGPVDNHDIANEARRKAAEFMREAFIASLSPDIVLIPSLFEGFTGEAILSVGALGHGVPTAVVIHDLIPLIYSDIYLNEPAMQSWYYNKLDHLRRADVLLSVSASSGLEAIEHLNFSPSSVVNISEGYYLSCGPLTLNAGQKEYLRNTFGVDGPSIMYAGDNDQRKNIAGLFEAFVSLPSSIRSQTRLVMVGRTLKEDHGRTAAMAHAAGLQEHEIILTGYVSDEDLVLLYNACTLFVFPSWHEGFGLPVLEAMACGRAVIAANASSLPEVVGREDALFAPRDTAAMAAKMTEVLSNPTFRAELERHGLAQAKKFSWDISARRAWSALIALHETKKPSTRAADGVFRRPRLAYVSQLPPERSGIADYSAELLPELARYYDIDVIVAQSHVNDPWVVANAPIRDTTWLLNNTSRYDRVVYQFGNSEYHAHMFDLLAAISGVVVLHDFFLSGVMAWVLEKTNPGVWSKAIVGAHGWSELMRRFEAAEEAEIVSKYPCNLGVLQLAQGVIVHSDHSRTLASEWYGDNAPRDWIKIPHLRTAAHRPNKSAAREKLNIPADAFLLCSFGFIAKTKLNHRLLAAWLASEMLEEKRCYLVFVGENDNGDYGESFLSSITESGNGRIIITGYAEVDAYHMWLAAADAAVQLRSLSRGETSGTVLDCMAYGLPTIVNAHGAMAELPGDGVWMLEDDFSGQALINAMVTLFADANKRQALGDAAREQILSNYNPRVCAKHYRDAIEHFYAESEKALLGGIKAIARQSPALPRAEWPTLSAKIAANFPPSPRRKQLLLDVSALVQTNLRTGVERVSRALLREITLNPPAGWAIEPVYANTEVQGYRYARRFMCRFLGLPDSWAEDEKAEAWPGDIFLGLDLQHRVTIVQQEYLHGWRRRGVSVQFVVYDLLPITLPEMFPEVAQPDHQRWLEAISCFDGALCDSRSVADEFHDWLQSFGRKRERPYALHWFHHGADIGSSAPTQGLPPDAERVLMHLRARPSFLMVGTVEPRKGYLQTISAFEQLWARGIDANLVVVGAEGWKDLPDAKRRTIPQIVRCLKGHSQCGKRLFWLEGISDEYLEKVYAASTCLVAASEGEGFGLPLIEAARHGLPLLVRDIPVFREVTAGHAHFFPNDLQPAVISAEVEKWLSLYRQGGHAKGDSMPYQTWQDSARQVLGAALGEVKPYRAWLRPPPYTDVDDVRGFVTQMTDQAII